jgi:hypothetical protein
MTDYSSIASHDIRLHLWDQLKSNNILTESDYYADGFTQPLIPIIPSQQVPEFNNLLPGKTYITYEVETLPMEVSWWMTNELITLMVVSPDYDQINKIMNFITDLMRRYDESVTDFRGSTIFSNNFLFHYTSINKIKSPAPMKQEGGLRVGSISILYCYSRKLDDSGRFA